MKRALQKMKQERWEAFKIRVAFSFLVLLFSPNVRAEVSPVAIRVPEASAWTGERIPIFVDVRARGSFSSATAFSLPDIPRTIIMKIGSPIVSSEEIEGESWFVQTHEFAMFSQASGPVEIPAFEVRFASRVGFTGPIEEQKATVPTSKVEIKRPPGTDNFAFLVTTDSLDISESWDPLPQSVDAGAVFKRTIVQRAKQLSGMALAPAPTNAPEGVRVYPGKPEVSDNMQRGAFLGERSETLTYLLQQPGTVELPALTYQWWNPDTQTLESKTLPAVRINVAALPATAESPNGWDPPWLPLSVAAVILGLIAWFGKRIAKRVLDCWHAINTPERIAARKLLRACRSGDAISSHSAWSQWINTRASSYRPGQALAAAILDLQGHLFGTEPTSTWKGEELANAFRAARAGEKVLRSSKTSTALPGLNP